MRNVLIGIRRIVAVAVVVTMAGCGGSADVEGIGEEGRPVVEDGVFTIGMTQSDRSDPWHAQMDADIETAAASHDDLKVLFKDAGGDSDRQLQQVEQFIDQRVDLIIINPVEAQQLTEPVAKAYDAGIPVIVLDRPVIGDKYTCFIGSDQKEIGAAAARWVTDNVPGRVNVVCLEDPERSPKGIARHEGFRATLIDPRFRILSQAAVSGKEDVARREMEEALKSFEKIDVVFAYNDTAAHDAYLAAKQAGRDADTLLLGIDALPGEGIEHVDAGELAVTFQSPTGGAEAVDMAVKLRDGEEVPKRISLKTRFFTKENLAKGGQSIE
ncbi:MAG TPA: substrate-binding domain-containing protein [Thermoguttaceae bacterium]|nr:substrate-binding domain-containing protein [Thermoguttaceae bacterium]